MTIKEFEAKIQKEIDKDLNIRVNPNHNDIAGVYWNNIYISVAVPPQEIRDKLDNGYTDAIGHPYRSIDMAIDLINGKLPKFKQAFKEDPSLFVDDK